MFYVSYHPEVARDIAGLGASEKRRIQRAIETKLVESPVRFGKPLQHSLSGLRFLRVGDHRVVFKIQGEEIVVLLIAHRSVVYTKTNSRV